MSDGDYLLRAILTLTARQALAVDTLAEVVMRGGGRRQLEAFNLCDGTRTQSDVVKAAKIDKGSFSKTVNRWVRAGILFRVGEGRETRLLHAYPLPTGARKRGNRK